MKKKQQDIWLEEYIMHLKLKAQSLEKELLETIAIFTKLELISKYPKK